MKFKQILIIFASAAVIISCNQDKAGNQQASSADNTTNAAKIEDDTTANAYQQYLVLKDALVASDAVKAKEAGLALSGTLSQIDGCENTSELALSISNSSDIKQQRKEFTVLSADLIALMKHTEINSGSVFVQYCPMANDGDGGYWLASSKEIRNPYYGDEMLNCGEVKEELK